MAETCQLALQRIERWRDSAAAGPGEGGSLYLSVDPMQVPGSLSGCLHAITQGFPELTAR